MPDLNQYQTSALQVRELGRIGNWADGDYTCQCYDCKRYFIGAKLARSCLPCAIKYLVTERESKLYAALCDISGLITNKLDMWHDFPNTPTTQAHIAGLSKIQERIRKYVDDLSA